MQIVDFNVPEKFLNEYVDWAKNSAVNGITTKEFEFNNITFFEASHVSLIKHPSEPAFFIASIRCDHIERKKRKINK